MMKSHRTFGHYKRAPINLHWTLLLAYPVFYYWSGNIFVPRSFTAALLGCASYAALFIAHEIGHAYVATKRGLDVLKIEVNLLGGRCHHQAPEYEADDVLIAWGGVAAQAVLLLAALMVRGFLYLLDFDINQHVETLFLVFIKFNVILIIINLLPVEGLDGHLAWRIRPGHLPKLRNRLRDIKQHFKGNSQASKVSSAEAAKIANDAINRIMNKDRDKV